MRRGREKRKKCKRNMKKGEREKEKMGSKRV
jgi:hypothetical protein